MRGHPSSTVSAWPEIVDGIVQRPMVESNMTAKKFKEIFQKIFCYISSSERLPWATDRSRCRDPVRHYVEMESKLAEVCIGPLAWSFANHPSKNYGSQKVWTIALQGYKKGLYGLTETDVVSIWLPVHGSEPDPLHFYCGCQQGVFIKLLTVGTCASLTLCLRLRHFSSYWAALSTINMGAFACLVVSCFVLFKYILLEACSFLKKKWKGSRSGGEEEEYR